MRIAAVVVLTVVAAARLEAEPPLLTGDVMTHDPSSIVKQGDQHYLFHTGRGIGLKSSRDLVEWTQQRGVFDRDATPDWIEKHVPGFRGHYWAPDVVFADGRYRVYYSASRFGQQASAIGLATNETLDAQSPNYAWRDDGAVVTSTPDAPYNAIDPSVLIDDQGRHWMTFGSFWKGIYLFELDAKTGLPADPNAAPTRVASATEIEAPTLIQRDGWFYLFVNHGLCCRGVESTYRILVGRSRTPTGPYLDRDGRDLVDGGGTLLLDSQSPRIGPGHVAPFAWAPAQGFGFHYYDANQRGLSKLGLADWQWSEDGWPTAADVRLAGEVERPRRRRRQAE
ncbi:Intracellular endo-alpha-(1-_5)-L-arabinanase [Posidoniimonas corsicana]|uniref:Intracellular endo-alpha-(1->5)-L-arabinanase n=1 Tax=Posidoniimonas corsicana TaxID=1938618 RepID=A0A5C5VBD4_9BACT|nr:arabinan endo-1,5-alpha-L-arabinosidase [Posidoniimonas corsicana]TWT35934.1 Intracellular endo-alpha-(1->5)-L-arabinanase [Posidoniimonas corsicana]